LNDTELEPARLPGASWDEDDAGARGGTLRLDAVSDRHRGLFRCVATNPLGTAERRFQLNVHTAPVIDDGGQKVGFFGHLQRKNDE
jgi:hypothetical protein